VRRKKQPWWILLLPLAFIIGRLTGAAPTLTPAVGPDPIRCPETKPCPSVQASTSTIAMCPCPKPKLVKGLPIKRKPREILSTGPAKDRDPTARTAQYLKEHAKALATCAPKSGATMRIHLEVTVTPEGKIDGVELTNLDPPPTEVADCVKKQVGALRPPGFDASEAETFALTVVL
jgi:hypothetical protein